MTPKTNTSPSDKPMQIVVRYLRSPTKNPTKPLMIQPTRPRRHGVTGQRTDAGHKICPGLNPKKPTPRDFDPGPYDTEVVRHKDRDWRQKAPILPSSDETGEDIPRGTRQGTYRDTLESEKLSDIKRRNKMMLSDMEREDIKQDPDTYIKKDPDTYIKQEPDEYTQPVQRRQYQWEPPPRELQRRGDVQRGRTHDYTAAPTSRLNGNRQTPEQFNDHNRQPPTYHLKREPPRDYNEWN